MPSVFPTFSWGYSTLYPTTRNVPAAVEIVQFVDGSEQRWQKAPILNDWTFKARLNDTDLAALQNLFDTTKGSFDSTWTFPFDGSSYFNCVFESDDLVIRRETASRIHYAELKIRQCKQSMIAGSVPASWPALNNAVITQYPYSDARRWKTVINQMANGRQFAWSQWNAPRRLWNLAYPQITPSELGTIMAAYISCGGPWATFGFTCPRTGVTYPTCRLDNQQLSITYNGPRQVATSVIIAEIP